MVTSTVAPRTREQIAQDEVGRTDVGPGTIRFLLVFFLLAIAVVPIYELWGSRKAARAGVFTPWGHLAAIPADASARASGNAGAWARLIARNRATLEGLHRFEEALEDDSGLGRTLRPRTQALLSGWLGAGNERAYTGRNGWLFYRPDVEYVTGSGFLDPRVLARRIEAAEEWERPPQPDPRKAILAFKRELDAHGIALVVVPTPLKPEIHPEFLAKEYETAELPLQNPSYASFVRDLQRAGVLVFDAVHILAGAARASQATQYLATDTHWRPEAMEIVAERLVAFVRTHVPLPEGGAGYRTEAREIRHLGDIAVMLDLPERQTLYPQETVTTRRVLAADGTPWRTTRSADVLVLGDSFSNIYSLASMGWGEGAGLVEHLSYVLQRPVDRIVQNDQGAYATRELLRRAGDDRLSGKRVVIYQFAARELTIGDWRVFD
jgi:hypothetical protein